MEKRERWKSVEAEKHLQQMNHILKAKGWRIEVLYDAAGRAYDVYPVTEHGHKPPHKDTLAEQQCRKSLICWTYSELEGPLTPFKTRQ